VDRAYIMYDGRVRVSGTVGELVWNEEVAEIYLGPTLTARMRERYPNPALERPTEYGMPAGDAWDAPMDGSADDPQWAAEGAWGVDGGPVDGVSMDDGPADLGPADGGSGDDNRADDARSSGGFAADAGPVDDDRADDVRPFGGFVADAGPADGGSEDGSPIAERTVGGGGMDGGPVEVGSAEGGMDDRGRPRAAADGMEPVWADDDDGEHGGADGRTGEASQG
jgi:hypothetical protein